MEILVFKTDIRNRKKMNEIAPHLESIQGIIKWNVDLKDIDNVLRIECNSIPPRLIEKNLQRAGLLL